MLIAPALQVDFNACYMQDRQKFPLECLRCLSLILIPVLSCFLAETEDGECLNLWQNCLHP